MSCGLSVAAMGAIMSLLRRPLLILELISEFLGLLILVLLSHEYFLNESKKLLREVLGDQFDDILMVLALLCIVNCVHV